LPELAELLSRPAVEVAPDLLGAVISFGGVGIRLTEVEAYGGPEDPGSHAFRRTPRSAIMYGRPAVLYCYASYGQHVCANVVTGGSGVAGAVLLRAGEVIEGVPEVRTRRPGVSDARLARGPGLLCRALQLTLAHNGSELCSGPVRLALASTAGPRIEIGPRVGLRRGSATPWRFWLGGEPTVSAYRAARGRSANPVSMSEPHQCGPSLG
jgi:DNA-3-methyladenine glycosylase